MGKAKRKRKKKLARKNRPTMGNMLPKPRPSRESASSADLPSADAKEKPGVLPSRRKLSLKITFYIMAVQIMALVIAVTVAMGAAALTAHCGESFSIHLHRAFLFSFNARGTTFLGVVLATIGTFANWIIPAIMRVGAMKGRSGMKRMRRLAKWSNFAAPGFLLAIWLFLVTWNFIFMPAPTFSVQQIAQSSLGIVVSIAPNPDIRKVGTAFWVDSKGYIVTSSRQIEDKEVVGVLAKPIIDGRMFGIAAGIRKVYGEVVYRDPSTTVEVVRVYDNPFISKGHGVAIGIDDNNHVEQTTEQYWVPCLADSLADSSVAVGDEIFLSVVEPTSDDIPQVVFTQGRVTSIGYDAQASKRFERIHTSLPFKPWYRGAPVLDASKRIIGIVLDTNGSDSSNAVLLPVKYLHTILNEAKPKMTDLPPTRF